LTTLGALAGDLAGAFLKRRLGIQPGGLFPVVDQLDFIVGALAFSLPSFSHMLSLELAATVLIVTPPIHFLMNYAAHKLGLKDNPW
jgi:CDP-2,3-bis-(O-geranylgeranyl)-sn-glycerol synthase